MIKKFKRIKKIAIFDNFNWDPSIPEFKKYNAFYGWNGTGKTAITRILSSIEKVEWDNIELEDDSECVIETEVEKTLKLSNNNIPDLFKNKIRVFNEDFVNENLNWAEGKAYPILIIGKSQKEMKEEIDKIEKELKKKGEQKSKKESEKQEKEKKKNKILEKARDEIKNNLREAVGIKPKSGRATDYINYTIRDVENILIHEDELLLNDEEISQLRNSVKEKEAKENVSEIKTNLDWIAGIIESSQKIFATVIPKAGVELIGDRDSELKEWLRIGYEIHKDKEKPVVCEFCKNEISEERLKELGSYFNEVFIDLVKEIDKTISAIDRNDIQTLNFKKEQFYNEFHSELLQLNNDFNEQRNKIIYALKEIKNNLNIKKGNPSEKIEYNFDALSDSIEKLKDITRRLNSLIVANNEKTKSFEEKRRQTAYKLEVAIVSKYKDEYNEIKEELENIEREIESLGGEIDKFNSRLEQLEQKLKEHHIAAEQFNSLLEAFLGRKEIVLKTVDDGYRIERNGKIARNLSEGERNAIALVYFLIKLKEEKFNATNGTIVIDDPVSSFDSNNIYRAFGFIKGKIKKLNPKQVFIFTHNFPFFRLIRNWLKHENDKSFYMIKSKIRDSNRYSVIERLDKLLEEHNSEYTFLFKMIYKRANSQQDNLEQDYILPNVIRKFLENYISFKVPIGGVNLHRKFDRLCQDYSEINAGIRNCIESFTQDQSHPLYQDSPTDFDTRLLGEIHEICSAVVELVEKTDSKHYHHLLSEIKEV